MDSERRGSAPLDRSDDDDTSTETGGASKAFDWNGPIVMWTFIGGILIIAIVAGLLFN